MYTFQDFDPQTPARFAITARGGLYDDLGDQVGHYLACNASPGPPYYRDTASIVARVYDRKQPGTGTGGHCNHRASTWASVADAKAWMLAQHTDHSTLV
jgi:hypothetical protein